MYQTADDVLSGLPSAIHPDLRPAIREEFLKSGKTLVVLDDDPTGTQTCYDVVVITSWNVPVLVRELRKEPSILFILTNSRSLTESDAVELAKEIGGNLLAAKRKSGRELVIVSRSDSTLRGHFPAEVDAVASVLGMGDGVRVLVPAFIEGGRVTIGDVHYVREHGKLIPVSETPFAQDAAFGYKNSNLTRWVEEKTGGRIKADEVNSISIEDLRVGGPTQVLERLQSCRSGSVCIVNACTHDDIEILVMGLLMAELRGQKFIYRTSATFVSLRAGLPAGKVINSFTKWITSRNGSLVVVGSYVPKTTRQLVNLLQENTHHQIEVNVRHLLLLKDHNLKDHNAYCESLIEEVDQLITAGHDVVIHTSRQLEKGSDSKSSLAINQQVSLFLVKIIKGMSARPRFIVAKGGITASDIATQGLHTETAIVLGQVIPGVPVWQMQPDCKYPDLLYTVFPGNVGDDYALKEVCQKLNA